VTRRLNVTKDTEVIGVIDYSEIVAVRIVVAMLVLAVVGLTAFILFQN
jgi:hypothetical protein